MKRAIKPTHGGARQGAGRKPSPDRCRCGKHTAQRAEQQRLRCRVKTEETGK